MECFQGSSTCTSAAVCLHPVLVCAQDADVSIRSRAVDLLFTMCDSTNADVIVDELGYHLVSCCCCCCCMCVCVCVQTCVCMCWLSAAVSALLSTLLLLLLHVCVCVCANMCVHVLVVCYCECIIEYANVPCVRSGDHASWVSLPCLELHASQVCLQLHPAFVAAPTQVEADYGMREELVLKIAILAEKFAPSVQWCVQRAVAHAVAHACGVHMCQHVRACMCACVCCPCTSLGLHQA